jgi:hypothetical protein
VSGVAPRCAAVRLSPWWISTPVGENLVEKGHEPREAHQVEHSAAGVSRVPHGPEAPWMRTVVFHRYQKHPRRNVASGAGFIFPDNRKANGYWKLSTWCGDSFSRFHCWVSRLNASFSLTIFDGRNPHFFLPACV